MAERGQHDTRNASGVRARRRVRVRPFASRGFLVSLVVLVLVVAGWASLLVAPGPLPDERRIVVDPGMGAGALARRLHREGVITRPLVFKVTMRLVGLDRHLRVGEFAVPAHASIRQVMRILRDSSPVLRFVTVPEGWTSAEVVAMVARLPGLLGDVKAVPPEGALLPDTYAYAWGEYRADLIERMRRAMREFLAAAWPARAPGLPLETPEEAVILASIVELETARAEERPMVAAVFLNRLRRGMRLQADPTVVYGAGAPGEARTRPPTRTEIARTTPFNTYRVAGLPPTPIANPGRAAILAVLHPASTAALYFVADGCGGHLFARTLAEHRRNVARWRRLREGMPADCPSRVSEASDGPSAPASSSGTGSPPGGRASVVRRSPGSSPADGG